MHIEIVYKLSCCGKKIYEMFKLANIFLLFYATNASGNKDLILRLAW